MLTLFYVFVSSIGTVTFSVPGSGGLLFGGLASLFFFKAV